MQAFSVIAGWRKTLTIFPMLKTQSENAININVRAVGIPQLVMAQKSEKLSFILKPNYKESKLSHSYLLIFTSLETYTNIHMNTYSHMHIYLHNIHTCIHAHTHIDSYVYVHTFMHMDTHMYAYMHKHAHNK